MLWLLIDFASLTGDDRCCAKEMLQRWGRPASRAQSLARALLTTALPALLVQPLLLVLGCVFAFGAAEESASVVSLDAAPLLQVAVALSRTAVVAAPVCIFASAIFAASVSSSGFGCGRPLAFQRTLARTCPWLDLSGTAPLRRRVSASVEVFVGMVCTTALTALVATAALGCGVAALAAGAPMTAATVALHSVLAVQCTWLLVECGVYGAVGVAGLGAWCCGPPPRMCCARWWAARAQRGGGDRIGDAAPPLRAPSAAALQPRPFVEPFPKSVEPSAAALADAILAARQRASGGHPGAFTADFIDLAALGVLERQPGAALAAAALAITAAEMLASVGPWGSVDEADAWAPQRTVCVGTARLSMSRAPGRAPSDTSRGGGWGCREPPPPSAAEAEAQAARVYAEVDLLAAEGVDVVAVLIPGRELAMRGLARLPAALRARRIECISGPGVAWRDKWVPSNDLSTLVPLVELARALAKRLRQGQRVHVHCHGGRGRTGVVVVATLVALGVPLGEALLGCRRARAGMLRNPIQLLYLWWYANWVAAQALDGRGDIVLWDTRGAAA